MSDDRERPVIDFLSRFPSTNAQVLASIVGFFVSLCAALVSYLVPGIPPIPETVLLVVFGFVAGYGGISTTHFAVKRRTEFPRNGE